MGSILCGGAGDVAGGRDGEARMARTMTDVDRDHTTQSILAVVFCQLVAWLRGDAHPADTLCQ